MSAPDEHPILQRLRSYRVQLEAAEGAVQSLLVGRDELMVDAREAGVAQARIAEAAGVHVSRVSQVTARHFDRSA